MVMLPGPECAQPSTAPWQRGSFTNAAMKDSRFDHEGACSQNVKFTVHSRLSLGCIDRNMNFRSSMPAASVAVSSTVLGKFQVDCDADLSAESQPQAASELPRGVLPRIQFCTARQYKSGTGAVQGPPDLI
jgi:hypothetical protein